jgi:hypothetical protein
MLLHKTIKSFAASWLRLYQKDWGIRKNRPELNGPISVVSPAIDSTGGHETSTLEIRKPGRHVTHSEQTTLEGLALLMGQQLGKDMSECW